MDFKELGHLLRAEREKQGLSVYDVHERIKISPSSIEAIEEGSHEKLPHMVYYKGFVRNYAVFLGLDPAECLKVFEEDDLDLEEAQSEVQPEPEIISDDFQEEGIGKKKRLISLIVTALLLVLLGWLLTKLFFSAPPQSPEEMAPVIDPSQQETVQSPQDQLEPETFNTEQVPALNASDQEPPATAEEPVVGADGRQFEEEDSSPVPETGNETGPDEVQPNTAEESGAAEEEPAQESTDTSEEQTLKISASEACWLSADMDNREKDIYLRPGESITLRFDEKLTVKLGNAGGVKLVYNEQPYPLQAASGEVMTIEFP